MGRSAAPLAHPSSGPDPTDRRIWGLGAAGCGTKATKAGREGRRNKEGLG